MVKSYNSYIIDKLWIGSDIKSNPKDSDGRMQFQKYLFDHGLDRTRFETILKGSAPQRPFIALQGQAYKGVIRGFKSDELGHATIAVLEADIGEFLFMEAPREAIFVHGHWMGKADLKYLLAQGDEVTFEIHRLHNKEEQISHDMPRCSLGKFMFKYFLMLWSKLLIFRFQLVAVTGFLRRIFLRHKGQLKPIMLIDKKKRKSKS